MNPPAVLVAAVDYTRRGFRVVPVPLRSKNPGKPGWEDLRLDEADLPAALPRESNIGVLLGEPSGGLQDVDLDCIEVLRLAVEFLPRTGMISGRPGSPGSHWWYRLSDPGGGRKLSDPTPKECIKARFGHEKQTLVELRGTGQQTIVPPSLHEETGELIAWNEYGEPASAKTEDLWSCVQRLAAAGLLVRYYPGVGNRDDFAMALAGMLLRGGWSEEAVDDFAGAVARAAGDEESWKRERKAQRTAAKIAGGKRATGIPVLVALIGKDIGPAVVDRVREWLGLSLQQNADAAQDEAWTPRGESTCTDVGNGRRLVLRHGRDLRYVYPWKRWLAWDGTRWAPDDLGQVERWAKETVRSIYREAAIAGRKEISDAFATHARHSGAAPRLAAMIAMARSENGISVLPADLDRDPWRLTCPNGCLDLRTGELLPNRREDLITKRIETPFDADARCPRWETFLQEIVPNPVTRDWLQRCVGYSLSGDTTDRSFFLLHGSGWNGKTVFVEVIMALLAEYAQRTPAEALMVQHRPGGNAPSPEVARLKGARFVSASELDEDQQFSESFLKAVTGGDTLTGCHKYGMPFDFKPTHKLWVSTNKLPKASDCGAFWDRMRRVPFTVTIPPGERDPFLQETLIKHELPGVLAWAVQGSVLRMEKGLDQPPDVLAAGVEYRQAQDTIARFLAERTEKEPAFTGPLTDEYRTGAQVLYNAFAAWCPGEGIKHPLSIVQFKKRLLELGYKQRSDRGGNFWEGIRLAQLAAQDAAELPAQEPPEEDAP
jgi:P4 family phage/plasmid primase-like protien